MSPWMPVCIPVLAASVEIDFWGYSLSQTSYAGVIIEIHRHKLPMQEFDAPDKLKEKVKVLVELLSTAKHVVAHTGAGISTAAGQGKSSYNHVMSRDQIRIRQGQSKSFISTCRYS